MDCALNDWAERLATFEVDGDTTLRTVIKAWIEPYDDHPLPEEVARAECCADRKIRELAMFVSAGNDWRPIAAAPKDGSRIILGRHNRESDVGFYAKATSCDAAAYSGWFSQGADYSDWGVFPPTHWRPLPAPPAPVETHS